MSLSFTFVAFVPSLLHLHNAPPTSPKRRVQFERPCKSKRRDAFAAKARTRAGRCRIVKKSGRVKGVGLTILNHG